MTPAEAWRARVSAGDLDDDAAQRRAVDELSRLHEDLVAAGPRPGGFVSRLVRLAGRRPQPVKGVYLWGSVGRGKTMLMDLFFTCLPFEDKQRAHFHRFMAGVHDALKRLDDRPNPLDTVADEIASRARIVCFDELSVTDIADAMILGNLFTSLFERGVSLAATSNQHPDELYREGLQRQRFLPAIAAIKENSCVLRVDGHNDYRLRVLERADVYQFPADDAADAHLARCFAAIAPDETEPPGTIDVLGRGVAHRGCADGVIWFDFDAICDGPRSQDDYIELSRLYQTVLVSGVPQFDVTLENQARRFVALVDEFYDRRVKLILSASGSVANLYQGKRLAREFERTRSRLQEMQSYDYLAAAHRP